MGIGKFGCDGRAIVIIATLLQATPSHATTRLTHTKTEIKQFDAGIAAFKAVYGVNPPGYIELAETPATLTESAKMRLRAVWPQFDFQTPQDLNGDGDTDDRFQLNGAECLVFFLGGIRLPGSEIFSGFSKNPRSPLNAVGQSRYTFFDFDSERLSDVDGDGFPEYLDPLPNQTTPYVYTGPLQPNGPYPGCLHVFTDGSRNLRSVYTDESGQFWKGHAYQIISPGEDRLYGTGGRYVGDDFDESRSAERDNVTNFGESLALNPQPRTSWVWLVVPVGILILVVFISRGHP